MASKEEVEAELRTTQIQLLKVIQANMKTAPTLLQLCQAYDHLRDREPN